MKNFPHFTPEQIQLLIVALFYTSVELGRHENLAAKIVDIDYYFEGMFGFPNPLDKRLLVNDPETYSANLFNPLIDSLCEYQESQLS